MFQGRTLRLLLATTAFAFTLSACSSDEDPGEEHGTPESVRLFDTESNTELPQPYALPSGTTTRVTVHFYDAAGDDISQELIDSGHFTALTFTASSFATVTAVPGEVFQRDVTVDAASGTAATLAVGYGHNEDADDRSFGPYAVTASDGAPAARTGAR